MTGIERIGRIPRPDWEEAIRPLLKPDGVWFYEDLGEVDRELSPKIPTAMGRYGYVLHTDHSGPGNVAHETYRYFIRRGLELGAYAPQRTG